MEYLQSYTTTQHLPTVCTFAVLMCESSHAKSFMVSLSEERWIKEGRAGLNKEPVKVAKSRISIRGHVLCSVPAQSPGARTDHCQDDTNTAPLTFLCQKTRQRKSRDVRLKIHLTLFEFSRYVLYAAPLIENITKLT